MQKPENRGHLGMMPQTGKGVFDGKDEDHAWAGEQRL